MTDNRGAAHTHAGNAITVNSPPGTGENQIEGLVWHDANGDGVFDEGEEPIPALVVFLDENDDGVKDSTEVSAVTNDIGEYIFEGLDADRTYTVTQELTLGWTNTAPGTGDAPPVPAVLPIIGGEEAEPGEFPFQVALVRTATRVQFCGGTFIAKNWVMTAAHCVDGGITPEMIKVLAGTHDLTTGGELIDVLHILIHPAFSATAFVSSDLALLELDGEYQYPRIELLLPGQEDLAAPGIMSTVVGWGKVSESGSTSDALKKLEAPIISNAECQTHLDEDILDTTICAGLLGSTEATCDGDSGGPLMVPFRKRWLQIGIVSFGTTICYQPTAFARVSKLAEYPFGVIPPERSGAVVVDWQESDSVVVNFGNFR